MFSRFSETWDETIDRPPHRHKGQKRLEDLSIGKKGYVGLYAETLMDREAFDEMYRTFNPRYDEIRKKYGCEEAFPHVYEKISRLGRT